MDLYLVSETQTEKKQQSEIEKQPNRERSADESLSRETQLLTRKDGGIKRWRENEKSRMRGRWRRDREKDWKETGYEGGEERSANRKLRPRFTAHREKTEPERSIQKISTTDVSLIYHFFNCL